MASQQKDSKLSRIKRKVRASLLIKLLLLFFAFISLLNAAHMFNIYRVVEEKLSGYFLAQLDDKVQTIIKIGTKDLLQLSQMTQLIAKSHPELAVAISNRDYDSVENILNNERLFLNCHGYVFTNNRGEIRKTSYTGYSHDDAVALRTFFEEVKNNMRGQVYNGYLKLLNQGPSVVTVHPLQDTTGYNMAFLLVCQETFADSSYLKMCSNYAGLDINVYKDSTCIASSSSLGTPACQTNKPIPDSAISDSIYSNRKLIHNTDYLGGALTFSTYMPICNYNGEVLGIYRASVTADIMTYIIFSVLKSMTFLALLCLLLFGIVIYVIIRHILTQPVQTLMLAARRIAKGDLTQPVIIRRSGGDEIQQLGESMAEMQYSLSSAIGAITRAAKILHASSEELSRASSQLSDGSNKQAASLEEISSSLEEMTGSIHQNTENAVSTTGLIMEADKAVSSIADLATDSMKDTRKIAGSIRAINSLVGQTNILSLNASVEAARAGSAGRGFAVVAKEVGRLADQTKATAANVSDTATKAIAGTENINGLLDEVSPQLHQVVALINEITTASKEQDAGAQQINTSISILNKVTQDTAANAEEIAANAEELSGTAEKMKRLVSAFKVDGYNSSF